MKNIYLVSVIAFFIVSIFTTHKSYASQLYWVGGSGLWNDASHWSLSSGGAGGAQLPDLNTNVLFDTNSGLTSSTNIDIPLGSFDVNDFVVTGTPAAFKFRFLATGIDGIDMNIHGDLKLISTHNIIYGDGDNKWIFHGKSVGSQEIKSSGQNLNRIELINENVNYHLTGNLLCSKALVMYGGNFTTNNFTIQSSLFGANTSMDKTIDAGTTTINCIDYSTSFTYGSLEISGDYTIYTQIFNGATSQGNGHITHHPKVILKDYEGGSSINDNNFECQGCVIDELIIENIFDTFIAGNVTIEEELEIQTPSTTIFFNTAGSYGNEITLNGRVVTPNTSGCDIRTSFESQYEETILFTRETGNLVVEDAILKNISTSGAANFTASNCLLMGNSAGWNETNSPATLTYHWVGNSGVNTYWDNPNNWQLNTGNTNGCLPTIIDNVVIDNGSLNQIKIRDGFNATCKNFTWIKSTPYEMYVEGDFQPLEIFIAGSFEVHPSATITGSNKYQFTFISTTNNNLTTNLVDLPELQFQGGGSWKFIDDINCSFIRFYEGTLIVNDINVNTDYWFNGGDDEKNLILGASHIKVTNRFTMEFYTTDNVHVTPGTSLIECDELVTTTDPLYNVMLTNTSPRDLSVYPMTLNSLILKGTGAVTVRSDITVDSLVFETNDAQLILHEPLAFVADGRLIVNEAIVSKTNLANPGIIKSRIDGLQVELLKPTGNLCVNGHVSFQDINAQIGGVMHAPDGIDAGNNAGINFASSSVLTPLYWVGNSGDWNHRPNWSNFSGGCPVNKDPNTALKLVFDENSFTTNNELITVPALTNCKTLEFLNTNYAANFDIQTRMNPLQVFVNGGIAKFTGYRMFVQVQTVVTDEGNLTLDILPGEKYDTPVLEVDENSIIQLDSNTLLKVRN